MKHIIAITFATLCLFSANLLADTKPTSIEEVLKATAKNPFLEGDKATGERSCGIRAYAQPDSKASLDEKFRSLIESANHCEKLNNRKKADQFRLEALTCKTQPVESGSSKCKVNYAVLIGSCTPAPAKAIPVDKTSCDMHYKWSFLCSRAAKGVPVTGITGDMSLGMGCAVR